jgi:ABC-type Fe2+-enterobactin transport system substrate-binding protein
MSTYSEMKGEEYKAEDHIKEFAKLAEKVNSQINDPESCHRLA